MNESDFLKLLHKYLVGNATEEERRFFSSYYELFDSNSDVETDLNGKQSQELKSKMQAEIWKKIRLNEDQERKVKPISRWVIIVSAAVLILTIGAVGISNFYQQPTDNDHIVIRVGKGERNRIMKFPSTFDGLLKREVSLEGQAYFDVQHNSKPFIICTSNLKTIVLGIAFIIKAYPADENILVTVTRGRVQVSITDKILGIVKPNQQLIYNKTESKLVQKMLIKKLI